MDERTKALCVKLRGMTSELAVGWLISNYSVDDVNWGEALLLHLIALGSALIKNGWQCIIFLSCHFQGGEDMKPSHLLCLCRF